MTKRVKAASVQEAWEGLTPDERKQLADVYAFIKDGTTPGHWSSLTKAQREHFLATEDLAKERTPKTSFDLMRFAYEHNQRV